MQNILTTVKLIPRIKVFTRQVKKISYCPTKTIHVSHDEIIGSLQFAYPIEDFVQLTSIYPDIRVVLGRKCILSELNTLLTEKLDEPILLSYGTTLM